MKIRKPAVAAVSAVALVALPAAGAAARTAGPAPGRAAGAPGPDFRPACSASSAGWAQCLALQRTNVVSYAGIVRNVTPAGYGPAALQSAYNLTQASAAAGQGQTVAVVDAYHDPNAAAN